MSGVGDTDITSLNVALNDVVDGYKWLVKTCRYLLSASEACSQAGLVPGASTIEGMVIEDFSGSRVFPRGQWGCLSHGLMCR
jgi:hypothetical protein